MCRVFLVHHCTEGSVIFLRDYSVPTPTHTMPKTCLYTHDHGNSNPQITQITNCSPVPSGQLQKHLTCLQLWPVSPSLCLALGHLCYFLMNFAVCQRPFAIFLFCSQRLSELSCLPYCRERKFHLPFTFDYMMG